MKKVIFTITILFACCATMMAQQAKIGYFSYERLLKSMPDYVIAMNNVEDLRKQYEDELKAAATEFNEKYEMFLDQQKVLDDAIRQKRQADLQALLDRNVQFRKESERLMKQAEADALAPVKQKLNKAIQTVGLMGDYLMIVNTDSEACPFLSPHNSENVSARIEANLK